jgi:hypothetical protein
VFDVAVTWLARDPRVDAAWISPVGPDGLGEQRGLSEASASDDRGQRDGEPSSDLFEQAGANELVGADGRRSWSSAPAARQGLVPHQFATLRQVDGAVSRYCRAFRQTRTGKGHESSESP